MGPQPAGVATTDDESLARRARWGDDLAFAALVERYQGAAFNFAYRFLGNYDDAVDAAQQGFIQLHTSLATLDLDRPLRPWLFRVIRNRAIDLLRQRRSGGIGGFQEGDTGEPSLAEVIPDPDPLPEDLAERADLQHLLVAAIRRLPARYREVVALRYTTDMTFGEIADVLEIPENTAKIHFHRAKALLRVALQDLA